MRRSSGYQAFKKGYTKTTPWESDWGEMAKKTVFRRCSKWLTLSPEIREAAERDDDVIDGNFIAHETATASSLETLTERMLSQPSIEVHADEPSEPSPSDDGINQDLTPSEATGDDKAAFGAYVAILATKTDKLECNKACEAFKAESDQGWHQDAEDARDKRIAEIASTRGPGSNKQ